jgi:16S rRNA (guanine1516-N2)-methyltransferase
MQAAMSATPRKIVIKRPLKGPYLAKIKPSYSLKGKSVRFDVLVL